MKDLLSSILFLPIYAIGILLYAAAYMIALGVVLFILLAIITLICMHPFFGFFLLLLFL